MTVQLADTIMTPMDCVPTWAKRPVAVVVFEGTVVDADDQWVPDVWNKLDSLRRTHQVVIVTPTARTLNGANALVTRLNIAEIPYDEVWLGTGFPEYERLYASAALAL